MTNLKKSESRTTSFSQIRQRSVSSYVLGSNSTTITTVTGVDAESKKQSQPVKKSVGIQHPPPKCDQSMQTPARTTTESPSTIVCMLVGPPKHLLTNREELIRCARLAVRQATAVQAKRSQSLTVNQASVKKASLPDLTFLNDYSSTPPAKTVTNKTVDQSTTTVSSTTGGELLKRKTLKSIKRYRQTKQNTEPCGLLLAAQHTQMAQQTLHQQYFTQHTQILPDNHLSLAPTSPDLAKKQLSKKYNNNSNKSTTKHRQSPPVNNTTSNERTPVENSTSSTSSSITSPTPRPRSLGAKKHQQQQSPGHKNVPYPPPLPPPHHNHHHASNLQRQTSLPGYTKPPQPTSSNKQPLKSCLKRKESSSTVPTPTTNTNTTKRIEAEVEPTTTINPKAASMFVPYVGYLFTCDQGSCTRYCYYNGLEKRRKMKLYKQLTSSARATNNRRHLRQEENSEEEDDEEEDEEDEIDDDEEDEEEELKSSGEKEALTETSKSTQSRVTVTNSSIVTNTYKSENDLRSLAKKQVKFSNSSNQTSTERTVEAPPLQYDTLIAMLKSRKPSAPQNKPTAPPPPLPPQQSPQFIKKRVSKPHQAPAVPIPTASVSKTFHHHHHMAIEADSISLASLSESPPSEFKFSDEEMDHDEEDDHEEDQVAAAALVLNEMAAIQSQVLMSKHGAQLVDYSKSIQIQQQRIAQLAEIRNKKKVFHNVLLNDQKLNNLKEILVEIKQQQQHQNTNTSNNSSSSSTSSASSASSNNNTSSTSSSSSSSSASSSALHQPQTTTNSIERLCQYLFDILKQSLKPIDTTLGLIRSTSASQSQEQLSSTLGQKQMSLAAATESNHVALSYSQYTQLWMLIEQTISSILSGNGPTNGGKFNLPREAIVNMFQEINRYSMLTNQTYLIDGVNSSPSATLGSNASMNTTAANSHQSQLRRKHHYMVMLMGLKFKFQLFIVNLLNHKQLSNWFDLLNRDRQLLKVYYDFKYTSSMSANQTNTSGDSGVSSEFMYASHCSSTNANSCSISSNISTQANHHLYELTSLANVSIFEHDEYYSYFHKLLQQFQHVDFHIKLNATCGPPTATITTTPSPTQTPTATQPKLPSTIKQGKIPHSNTTTIYQNSQPNSSGGSSNSSSGGSSSTFNLKSISKRLNIKSWFTSSSSMVNQTPPTKTHHNHHHHNSSATTRLTNFTQQHKHKMSVAEKSGHLGAGVGCLLAHHNSAMTSNPIYSKPPPPSNHRHHNTTATNESLMKHSLSEPSLNSIINMS